MVRIRRWTGDGEPKRVFFGPFPPYDGRIPGIPLPLDSGPAQPEPEERWTLGPHPTQAPAGTQGPGRVVIRPVRGVVTRRAGDR